MPAEDYKVIKELGRGAFGVVYQVRNKKTGAIYAMKEIKGRADLSSATEELVALHTLKQHPYIVNFKEWFEQTNLYIVMEFCSKGNLENYVIEKRPSDKVLQAFMKQMADAIRYSHSNKIVHRDLKPENVLVTIENGEPIAKIADFGVAKIKDTSTPVLLGSGLPLISYMETRVGTHLYMAPEVFKGHYTEKADVFSLGVMFCAILERPIVLVSGHRKCLGILFSHEVNQPIGYVLHKNPNEVRKLGSNVNIPQKNRNIINSMIRASYKSRPSAEDVYKSLSA